MVRMAMAGGGFPGMQPPPKEEGVTYLCVVDARITDHRKTKSAGQASSPGPKSRSNGPRKIVILSGNTP